MRQSLTLNKFYEMYNMNPIPDLNYEEQTC